MFCRKFLVAACVVAGISGAVPVSAQQQIQIRVENLQPADGFYLTPVWFGIHGGGYDLFDPGAAASAGLEALAEEGMIGGLNTEFDTAQPSGVRGVIANPGGFGGAPVLDPGELGFIDVNVVDTVNNRYFSYASMVIPSNDAFIGNGNPVAHELFDALGNFNGPLTIDIFGANIWDSGTEVNDTLGAAFSTIGGTSSDENGVVQLHAGLANFLGTGTAAQTTIGSIPGAGTLLARITITAVPEPSGMLLVVVGGVLAASRRRWRTI